MIGDIIGAASSLLGGFLNRESAEKNRESQERIAAQNIAMQKEFAQSGVRWKVDDARAAGVHPLFALGASTHSFSPVSVGGSADTSMGDAVASAGQNIGRAAQAGMTKEERAGASVLDALTIEKAGLENEMLRTQIRGLKQKQLPPPIPSIDSAVSQSIPGQPYTDRQFVFAVPEKGKAEEREPLMAHGYRWLTSKDTSPQQAWENQYGDDFAPIPFGVKLIQTWDDLALNSNHYFRKYRATPGYKSGAYGPEYKHGPSARGIDEAYRRSRPSRW